MLSPPLEAKRSGFLCVKRFQTVALFFAAFAAALREAAPLFIKFLIKLFHPIRLLALDRADILFHLFHLFDLFLAAELFDGVVDLLAGRAAFTAVEKRGDEKEEQGEELELFCYPFHGVLLKWTGVLL